MSKVYNSVFDGQGQQPGLEVESGVLLSIGGVPGHSLDVKFGHIALAMASTEADVWEIGSTQPVYIFPDPGGEDITIESTDGADTQVIVMEVLDINGVEQTVSATLDGLTPVAVTGTVVAVNRAYNDGAVLVVGNVLVKGAVSGNIFAYIENVEQQTTQCIYIVPAGKYALIKNISASMNRSMLQDDTNVIRLVAQAPGKIFRTQIRFGLQQRGTSNISADIVLPPAYPPLTRLKVTTFPDSDQNVSAEMSIQLIDEDLVNL